MPVILSRILELGIEYGAYMFEMMSVIVVILTGIRAIIRYIRRDSEAQIKLFNGLAMGLSFALGGEILHTFVTQKSMMDLLLVGATIVLRIALTVLMHWELKHAGHRDITDDNARPEKEELKEEVEAD